MKIKNTIILGLILVSTNTLSNGKWLDWGVSSITNLDKVISISGGIIFKNRCNNGYSWTLDQLIDIYRNGQEHFGLYYDENDKTTLDVTNYDTYKNYYKKYKLDNPDSNIGLLVSKKN
ncbi:hypothetical protein [uncultured Gammaproteobacteria bacterium]|uniref:hypothetical protein n=1 Tax=Bathymodiolus heckerae thiotrophic gill symbiont TaxID=1052212 RepID=UPI0010B42D24|nr:hypothetical protein [Bathymodiolus heckerae thiotrophic gill symbiont]CAC9538029.1 hypothetical protein [uncultured Gammaproteobacteria bacterium]CAC9593583.1 hypothetical protein [uncultured Gammaproteobacteria bacterium]CAC9607620.1 hypothetical protein [uncultured Gammaproteobacteria bacterium]SHN90498.1 hypothetical protein BHECKSOX_676 [Bathymodiolus heckerae thiotrophic gill symbiont]